MDGYCHIFVSHFSHFPGSDLLRFGVLIFNLNIVFCRRLVLLFLTNLTACCNLQADLFAFFRQICGDVLLFGLLCGFDRCFKVALHGAVARSVCLGLKYFFFLVLGNITYTHCVYAGADSNDVEVLPLLFFFDGPHLRSAPDFIDLKWMQPVDFWDIFYGST